MASITTHTQKPTTENKLFIENYKILQSAPESKEESTLTHNYHTVDLVTNKLSTMSLKDTVDLISSKESISKKLIYKEAIKIKDKMEF